ncbi:MAG: radical SAM protein [Elusimicrobiota bacterium]
MRNQKILLVKLYTGRKYAGVAPPLGIMYIASYARAKMNDNCQVRIVDMRIDRLDAGGLEKILKDYSPDIVGMSACSEEDKQMHEVSLSVKTFRKEIVVIAGGPHPTLCPEEVLEDENIDIVVRGEGEVTFTELLERLCNDRDISDVMGITYRKEETVVSAPDRPYIEDLDKLPFPAWDMIEVEKYSEFKYLNMNAFTAGKKYMGIVTSRGCPYGCIYCHNIFGKRFRKRSAENVFHEIQEVVQRYDIDEIHIYDDIFNYDVERTGRICDLIAESDINIKLAFPNGIRGDILNEELIKKLNKAGTYMLTFALESASLRIQKLIKKNVDIPRLLDNIMYADSIGILTKSYFMIGFPGETEDEIIETISFACSTPLLFASFFVATPQKGTGLYKLAREHLPSFGIDYGDLFYYSENKKYETALGIPLKKIQRVAYRNFYLDISRALRILIKMPRKIFLIRKFMTFISFLR